MQSNESILAVDYRIDGDVLYRYHSKPSKVVERIVPWGPEAAAWRIATGEWQPFVPEFDVSYLEVDPIGWTKFCLSLDGGAG